MRELLLARVRFLAAVALAFVCIGTAAELLDVADPYPSLMTVR